MNINSEIDIMEHFLQHIFRAAAENDILENSLNEPPREKPVTEDFKNNLETIIYNKDEYGELSCSICQDEFKENEECIKLPCDENPHYFHKCSENQEGCLGIMPWLEKNNTCPICRSEFPYTEAPIQREEQEQVEQEDIQMNIPVIRRIPVIPNVINYNINIIDREQPNPEQPNPEQLNPEQPNPEPQIIQNMDDIDNRIIELLQQEMNRMNVERISQNIEDDNNEVDYDLQMAIEMSLNNN